MHQPPNTLSPIATYTASETERIAVAYNADVIDSSLDLLAHSAEVGVTLPDIRFESRELFRKWFERSLQDYPPSEPQTCLVVGGMAVGKSTFIETLRHTHPDYLVVGSAFRNFLPEYGAFVTHGKDMPSQKAPEYGAFIMEHAGRFIHSERALLRSDAITMAAGTRKPFVLETHPFMDEIELYVAAAREANSPVTIYGLDVDLATALRNAKARAERTGQTYNPSLVELTSNALEQHWNEIAGMGDRAIRISHAAV